MKFKSIVVMAGIVIGCMSVSSAFTDMPKEHWAYDKVAEMTSKEIITGYTDGTFKPNREVTREEFATILTKALDLKTVGEIVNFRDVEDSRWSKKYIDASSRYLTGYLNNGNYYFAPSSYAVREDMAVAVVKAKGLDDETPDYSVLDRFSDKDKISEKLKKYIAIAVENGIMNGNANGTFNPLGNLTRAEITALMSNVMEKVVIDDEVGQEHVHKLATKYIYKSETSHTEEKYCKTCGEVIESKLKAHTFEDDECECGYERVHTHELRTKYVYKDATSHIEQEYCRKCDEVVNEKTVNHKYENGICVCGIEEVLKEIIYGDVNGDGKVSEEDAILLYNYSMFPEDYANEIPYAIKKNADKYLDLDQDGNVDVVDAIVLKAFADGKIKELPHKHKFVNNECACGYEKEIIYGDVNSDGEVNGKDRTILARYIAGWEGYEKQVNKENADVFVDGKLDKMDYIVIGRYIAKWNMKYPHKCGSYVVKYEKIDSEKHKEIYECKCGQIKYEEEINHEFEDGECKCGYEKEVIYGDIDGNGEVNARDALILASYISGREGYEGQVNKEIADVFADGKLDIMDYVCILKYRAGWNIEFPHKCGSYTVRYEKIDSEKHKEIYECKCGKVNLEIEHNYQDDIWWECEYEKEIIYGDADADGKVTSNDTILISKYASGENIKIDKQASDVNLDGKIDMADALIVMDHIFGMANFSKLPHDCQKAYTFKIKQDDAENHEIEYTCGCGISLGTITESHEFEDGECVKCGYEKEIIYGDVTGDGLVSMKDASKLFSIISKPAGEIQVNKEIADVFVDGKLDKMDYIVIVRYVSKLNIEYPHKCGSYVVKYEKIDSEKHKEIYECKCGQIKYEGEINHEFEDDECVKCGYEKKIIYGDVNSDGVVDYYDVAKLTAYLKDDSVKINLKAADVNEDGIVDNEDLTIIYGYFRELIDKLPHKHKYVNNKCDCGYEKEIIKAEPIKPTPDVELPVQPKPTPEVQ